MNAHSTKKEFYLRNFTWGLPVNIGGAAVALGLLATGHKAHKYGDCIQFDVGKSWGGGSLGVFMFTCDDADDRLKAHEHGHSIQNAYLGPLMPFVVNIPSSTRFWSRKIAEKLYPGINLSPYDSAWFEGQATELGTEYMRIKNANKNEEIFDD